MLTRLSSFATLALAPAALAQLSQANAPTPGGFLQTGAFRVTCACSLRPGGDIRAYSTGPDFAEDTFLPAEQASVASSYADADTTAASTAVAGYGFLRGSASRRSPDTNHFTSGILNGGWNDTFTISHPARTGQTAYLRFRMRAQASLIARDLTGSAGCQIAIYADGNQVPLNPHFDLGNADISIGNQWVQWAIANFGSVEPATRAIDGHVTFAVPFTFGQPFRLGVYGTAFAGQRSSGGFGGTFSSASIDLHGIAWDGLAGIESESGPVTGFTIVSGSGVDWTGPIGGGCPADVNSDGFLDFFDYDDFVASFEQGGPLADFNGDGFVDFFDYDDFVAAFEAGC